MKLDDVTAQLEEVANTLETYVDNLSKKGDLIATLTTFSHLKDSYKSLDAARKRIYKQYDYMDKAIVPAALEASGMDKVRVPDLGKSFYTLTKYSASIRDKEGLFKHLRDAGDGDLIQETLNSGTMATYLKGKLLDEGVELPEELVVLTSYNATGSSKYTPK